MLCNYWILGDWGTTRLRLNLVRSDGVVIEQKQGPGISKMSGDAEHTFFNLCQTWIENYSIHQIVLSGMVGSNMGWHNVVHLPCPFSLQALCEASYQFTCRQQLITLVPGVSCMNVLGYHDVMRGEEVQIIGAIFHHAELKLGRQLICLPGTHSKWLQLQDGEIIDFITIPTGELFELIRSNSTLVPAHAKAEQHVSPVFKNAVLAAKQHPVLVQLFQVRSRALKGELSPSQQLACLSGL